MMRSSLVALIAAVSVLAGCNSPLGNKMAAGLVGVSQGAPQVLPPAGAPEIWMSLPSKGIKFAMAKLETRKGVEIWVAQDGAQLFLRGGMIIGTRGFGQDLMSADVPDLKTIRSLAAHQRRQFQLDGTDSMQQEAFECKTVLGAADKSYPSAQTYDETCENPQRVIRNQFSVNSAGHLLKSRQWVSKGVGFAIIEAKVG